MVKGLPGQFMQKSSHRFRAERDTTRKLRGRRDGGVGVKSHSQNELLTINNLGKRKKWTAGGGVHHPYVKPKTESKHREQGCPFGGGEKRGGMGLKK